jgi:hypothetical protein
MKFHLNVSRAPRGRRDARRCTSMLAMAFACAALFAASQFANQAAAQSRFDREIADHVLDPVADRVADQGVKPAQDTVTATMQTSAAVATPADVDGSTSVLEAPVPEAAAPGDRLLDAPISSLEEASLVSPTSNKFLSLALEGGQSSSSQNLPPESSASTAPAAHPRPVKTKSPHHGLGVALAIVGSTALAVGIASYTLGGMDICANEKSGGCKEARDAGLVLMPAGGAVAVTGFYLVFHH